MIPAGAVHQKSLQTPSWEPGPTRFPRTCCNGALRGMRHACLAVALQAQQPVGLLPRLADDGPTYQRQALPPPDHPRLCAHRQVQRPRCGKHLLYVPAMMRLHLNARHSANQNRGSAGRTPPAALRPSRWLRAVLRRLHPTTCTSPSKTLLTMMWREKKRAARSPTHPILYLLRIGRQARRSMRRPMPGGQMPKSMSQVQASPPTMEILHGDRHTGYPL